MTLGLFVLPALLNWYNKLERGNLYLSRFNLWHRLSSAAKTNRAPSSPSPSSVTLYLSFCLCLSVFVFLSLSLSFRFLLLSVRLSVLGLFFCLYTSRFVYPPISLSVSLSFRLCLTLSAILILRQAGIRRYPQSGEIACISDR